MIECQNIKIDQLYPQYDLILCFGGFEKRVLAFFEKIGDIKTSLGVVFKYKDQKSKETNTKNTENLNWLIKKLNNIATEVKVIENDPDEPKIALAQLESLFANIKKRQEIKILIDISGCNTAFLINMIHFFNGKANLQKQLVTHFVYTRPETYKKQISNPSVRYVSPIENYTGSPDPMKDDCVFIFAGFESNRSLALADYYDPAEIILLVDRNPSNERDRNAVDISLEKHRILTDRGAIIQDISFINLPKILQKLKELIDLYSRRYNIVIGCFGSKIQSIAAAILAIENRNLIIVNARPDVYSPRHYSVGIGETYYYEILFK